MVHTQNPIIEAYAKDTAKSTEERAELELFITPEAEWLEYIEKDLIGFEYTEAQKIEARNYLKNKE